MTDLHPAIERARAKIDEYSEELGVDLLVCDRCDGDMVVRNTQISDDPCRNDIRIKCDRCKWWTRHGVPISRAEYEDELERRPKPFVDAVNTDAPESSIEDRLEALGYLDR